VTHHPLLLANAVVAILPHPPATAAVILPHHLIEIVVSTALVKRIHLAAMIVQIITGGRRKRPGMILTGSLNEFQILNRFLHSTKPVRLA
jgi:hypothetical protein